MASNYDALVKITKSIGLNISPEKDFKVRGYVIVTKGDAYAKRFVLRKLGFEWNGEDRTNFLLKDVFENVDYNEINIGASFSTDEIMNKFQEHVATIKDSFLHELCNHFLDSDMFETFVQFPAGKSHHHAYKNGLGEHTIQVIESALKMSEVYPYVDINRDLLIAGGLLHDIGKIECYSMKGNYIKTTPMMYSVGHVVKGVGILHQIAERIKKPINKTIFNQLIHIVVSHQLLKEWDSVREPNTPEAWIIYCCDQLSSKIGGDIKTTV